MTTWNSFTGPTVRSPQATVLKYKVDEQVENGKKSY